MLIRDHKYERNFGSVFMIERGSGKIVVAPRSVTASSRSPKTVVTSPNNNSVTVLNNLNNNSTTTSFADSQIVGPTTSSSPPLPLHVLHKDAAGPALSKFREMVEEHNPLPKVLDFGSNMLVGKSPVLLSRNVRPPVGAAVVTTAAVGPMKEESSSKLPVEASAAAVATQIPVQNFNPKNFVSSPRSDGKMSPSNTVTNTMGQQSVTV